MAPRRQDPIFVYLFGALVLVAGLGCIIPHDANNGYDGDGLFPDYSLPDDDWEEDVAERRRERDDPTSAGFRGDFDLRLRGAESLQFNAKSLGEATHEHIARDLLGTPPHCQITLADREPDGEGRQGYLILQVLGDDCSLAAGTHAVVESVEVASAGDVVVKSMQVDRETDESTRYATYTQGKGSVFIDESGSLLSGLIDIDLSTVEIDDDGASSSELAIDGDFRAVARERL